MKMQSQQRSTTSDPAFTPVPIGLLQRKCACGNHTMAGGECAECAKNKSGLQRKLATGASNDPLEQEADRIADQVMAAPSNPAVSHAAPRIQRFTGHSTGENGTAPSSVDRVLASGGRPLDLALQQDMGQRFGHDFSRVRVHTGGAAEQSARAVNAHAYTVGYDMVFGAGRFAPGTHEGRRLLAHELTHIVQQGAAPLIQHPSVNENGERHVQSNGLHMGMANHVVQQGMVDGSSSLSPSTGSSDAEANADVAADAALSGGPISVLQSASGTLQRRAAPFIKKITIHLAPPQTAELQWQGTPPTDATGSDSFTVSTGKGYGDPGDPPGTCTRNCCSDPLTQCAPPWNRPDRVGACCTYYGNNFWTGRPLEEHNGWKWWTPIQPWYSSRGIALHQHTEVTGQPIGHGCVRMDEPNAKRIYDYSNGTRTNVTTDGRAAPVACDEDRRCGATAGARGELEGEPGTNALASRELEAVPGLEGVMT